LNKDQIAERGARMARRDDREYRTACGAPSRRSRVRGEDPSGVSRRRVDEPIDGQLSIEVRKSAAFTDAMPGVDGRRRREPRDAHPLMI
jgi:hypothetical protein